MLSCSTLSLSLSLFVCVDVVTGPCTIHTKVDRIKSKTWNRKHIENCTKWQNLCVYECIVDIHASCTNIQQITQYMHASMQTTAAIHLHNRMQTTRKHAVFVTNSTKLAVNDYVNIIRAPGNHLPFELCVKLIVLWPNLRYYQPSPSKILSKPNGWIFPFENFKYTNIHTPENSMNFNGIILVIGGQFPVLVCFDVPMKTIPGQKSMHISIL